jgi:hypothetical protein
MRSHTNTHILCVLCLLIPDVGRGSISRRRRRITIEIFPSQQTPRERVRTSNGLYAASEWYFGVCGARKTKQTTTDIEK